MYSADKVLYSVREMYQGIDGNLYPVEEGQQLAGAKGANYKVSYSDGTSTSKDNPATLKTTNTLLTKCKMVKKGTEAGTPNLEGTVIIHSTPLSIYPIGASVSFIIYTPGLISVSFGSVREVH